MRFINGGKIVARHELDMGNPKLNQMAQACPYPSRSPGVPFCQTEVLARVHNPRSGMAGHVPHADLIYDGIGKAGMLSQFLGGAESSVLRNTVKVGDLFASQLVWFSHTDNLQFVRSPLSIGRIGYRSVTCADDYGCYWFYRHARHSHPTHILYLGPAPQQGVRHESSDTLCMLAAPSERFLSGSYRLVGYSTKVVGSLLQLAQAVRIF